MSKNSVPNVVCSVLLLLLLAAVVHATLLSSDGELRVSIVLGASNLEEGLFLDYGGDVDTTVVRVGASNTEARCTGNGRPLASPDGNKVSDLYMQFRVDDSMLFAAQPTNRVRLEIEYYDVGTDAFRVEYDAQGTWGPLGDGRFVDSGPIHKSDSRTFKVTTLNLDGVYFGNRDNGADFRISDCADGAETVRKVTVTLLPTDGEGTEFHGDAVSVAYPDYDGIPVDASTLDHKVLYGYQGWFGCPGDGSAFNSWMHWFRGDMPIASRVSVDYWPDLSELSEKELFATHMTLPDGSPAKLFSSYREETVVRHFQWMEEYGIDGVFAQRFVAGLEDRLLFEYRTHVLENVRAGAEAYGRVFAVMYDISGVSRQSLVEKIKRDWTYLVDVLKITESPCYLHHNGQPVLAIWGLGFGHTEATPEQAMVLIRYLQSAAEPRYRVTLMGGVPTHWRTLTGDSKADTGWAEAFRSFDVISPWTVGRYVDELGAWNFMNEQVIPDMREAARAGVEYMPVVCPGFSWHNLFPDEPLNQIPRNGGRFFWSQVYNALFAGASMLYVAMFDEVDEGTAMFKLAPTRADIPTQGSFVSLDIDGYALPSDWYLQLGEQAARMLRGEIPLSSRMPIAP